MLVNWLFYLENGESFFIGFSGNGTSSAEGVVFFLKLQFVMRWKKCRSHLNTGCLKQIICYITRDSQSRQIKSAASPRVIENLLDLCLACLRNTPEHEKVQVIISIVPIGKRKTPTLIICRPSYPLPFSCCDIRCYHGTG
jgi:hypothetical protein